MDFLKFQTPEEHCEHHAVNSLHDNQLHFSLPQRMDMVENMVSYPNTIPLAPSTGQYENNIYYFNNKIGKTHLCRYLN